MILIKNGKIVTVTKGTLENGCVLIKDGKILEISEDIKVNEDVEVIDAKGGWVTPGFIDAHCHIGIFEQDMGFEGMDINEATDPLTPHLRAIDAINPMDTSFKDAIKGGVTTVMTGPGSANPMGGQFVAMKTSGICVDDMVVKEPAAIKIAFGENPKRIYKSKNKMPTTRMATAALIREILTKAKNYKIKKEKAIKEGRDFEENFRLEPLMPVLDNQIPLKAHCHRTDDILTAIRIGKEFDVNITLDHCSEGHLIPEHIKKSRRDAIVGPTLTARSKIEVKNKTFKTPKVLHDNGVKIAIMTDHPVIPIEYLPLCAGLAAKEGLGIKEALKAITINAAEICGIDNRVGSLEVGKDADIVISNGNPLDSLTSTTCTIINGKIEYINE
ncbi:amidohydrolase [Clostridium botulinum]|uniref:Amidohydrolase n=2 Tax=Clostridium botulinum TaxID=1491 RepID=A0A0A0IKP9_CLOBO|nr:amidohydrolase [Clostridium botulinum]KEI01082.1 amidohydrolase [Clostridium botulinum C/D str. BKT75002]KEI13439.1 amidohydrolase [Clostridium botulinum C/D str. BKT2873]KGM95161.1 amidohydrolase [Clostridium botulinum D str. CCUG 7971]KGN00151.1 amidohydrolase [Clostridium botulinum C/D str. DC5]KOC50744.1 amidohydrolase [Clostridium botulinum]